MNFPFILAFGLLLWGWQTQNMLAAIVMALIIEWSRLSEVKWDISDKDFNRIADLTAISFIIFSIYQFNEHGAHGIFSIFANLPFLFFPILVAQIYSKAASVHRSSIFMSLRNMQDWINENYPERLDLRAPYLVISIVSASAGNTRTILFYIFICLILAYGLYFVRSKRYNLITWIIVLVLTCIGGYGLQYSMILTQARVELLVGDFLEQFHWRNRSPDKTNTAIGSIGKLKLSDQIHLRVKTDNILTQPVILHEAAYSTYSIGIWRNNQSAFTVIDPELNGREWNISKSPTQFESLTISAQLYQDKGVIPIPNGTFRIDNISAIELDRNNLGTVRLENKPGWNTYDVHYNEIPYQDSLPVEDDLRIHDLYSPVIRKISDELQLGNLQPANAIVVIKDYFKNNFKYNLNQSYKFKGTSRIHDFLLYSRQGHCEFFATATTLLLRAANIPARYNVGYAVHEFSNLENRYIARARDAHSWATAYVNGRWHIIDTTPPAWIFIESQDEPWWIGMTDIYSWLKFLYSDWKNIEGDEEFNFYPYVLGILFIILILRLKSLQQFKRFVTSMNKKPDHNNVESVINTLIQHIEKYYPNRMPGETVAGWIGRIGLSPDYYDLGNIIKLYYQSRFDPRTQDNESLIRLRKKIQDFVNHTILPVNP